MNQVELLAAYSAQLREEAECRGADRLERRGPLVCATFGQTGFVTSRRLEGGSSGDFEPLVGDALRLLGDERQCVEIEWKVRGDDSPLLLEALRRKGFRSEEPETVLAGDVRLLTAAVATPEGVRVRRAVDTATLAHDVTRVVACQAAVQDTEAGPDDAAELIGRLTGLAAQSLWLAETADEVICSGRLDVVAGTEFAGLWGGGTRPEWRGRGIYRALTAARAQAAFEAGARYLYCDCTPLSAPILRRSGLVAITTTTPYVWRR